MYAGFQVGAFQPFPAYQQGVTAPAASPVTQTPAGRPKRKTRYYVEIDGQSFPVESVAHAQALLDQAREAAQTHAQTLAAEVVPKRLTKTTKPVALPTPVIRSPDDELQALISATRKAINAIYRQAAVDAELQIRLAQQMAAEDEEEAITLLLM